MSEAQAIVSEHRALHQLRDALRRDASAVPADDEARWRARLGERLAELRARLEDHFGREERAGLFDHLADGASEYVPAAAHLRREHDALRAALGRLCGEAADAHTRAHVLAERVRTLLDDLASHEMRENELLVRGLDGAIAAGD